MVRILLVLAFAFTAAGAQANDLFGLWRSETADDGGYIHVRIGPCADDGAKVCGVIDDAFNEVPENANPARRAELQGKNIIRGMVPDGANEWGGGTIWAPDDDKTYDSVMELDDGILEVSGCVLAGLICRGQDWTRVE